jgi:hypothetical protein
MDGDLIELLGVFAGGALPWLEAIVVIPIGIAAGLPPAAVVIAGATGNLLTIAVAAFAGERVRDWWRRRRGRGHPQSAQPAGGRRSRWILRAFDRWGLAGLAVLGPLGLGTQISVVVAVSYGHSAKKSFTWIAAGTVLWCIAVAILASLGLRVAGVGAA